MNHQNEKIMLIDASGIMHAAWHAFPERLGEDNLSYRMIHGFFSKMHRLEKFYQWDKWIIVLDPEGGSFYRKSIFQDYKANRPPVDPDLKRQKIILEDILTEFGMPTIKVHGVEADDLIGTISKKEASRGNLVLICSGDKDILQLVNENVNVLVPNKGEKGIEFPFNLIDYEGVMLKTGVSSDLVAQWLAIMGDNSDNIPGIDGVGPKTASKWLREFGSIENIIKNAEKLKKHEKIIKDSEGLLETSLKLTTIQTDLDFSYQLAPPKNTISERAIEFKRRIKMPPYMGLFNQDQNEQDQDPFS